MKLELKHLTPYPTYGLKMTKEDWGKTGTLVPWIMTLVKGLQIELDYAITTQAKPLLRPLEEIGENQELFHQINEPYQYPDYGHFERSVLSGHASYALMTYLASEHYDVFGLIEQGLAIDLNTVEKS